jgi:hypothetical protein
LIKRYKDIKVENKFKFKRVVFGFGVFLLVFILGYLVIRAWVLRWGATAAEVSAALPGDLNGPRWTHAITIAGTPEQVWPWLVQWGQGRGGWYSYDWLENLFGLDIHTAERILPEYQNPALGDEICMGKGFCVSQIAFVEPTRVFGWNSKAEDGSITWSFTFVLTPAENGATRLVMRESFDPAWMPAAAVQMLAIPDSIMGQKALDTVKGRVEGRLVSPLITAAEIAAWLVAFAVVVFSMIRMGSAQNWAQPLVVGILGVLALLAITFLFPPLWMRGLLDLLLVGVVWVLNYS